MFPKLEAATEAPAKTLQQQTREFQRKIVRETLEKNDWNVTETARQLDLARSHVYNLIKEFQLHREAGKKGADNQGGKE